MLPVDFPFNQSNDSDSGDDTTTHFPSFPHASKPRTPTGRSFTLHCVPGMSPAIWVVEVFGDNIAEHYGFFVFEHILNNLCWLHNAT